MSASWAIHAETKLIDPDTLIFARALRDQGTPMPDIAQKLTIKTGKNAGKHPSVASPLPRTRRQRGLTSTYTRAPPTLSD